jgi:hypothetical protein
MAGANLDDGSSFYDQLFPQSKAQATFTSFDVLSSKINKAAIEMQLLELHTRQMQKMGAMFGLLFGGMQLQRMGLSIMRFVLPSMEKMNNYVSNGTKRITAMNAAFQFLKFSMFESLTQSKLFIMVTDFLIRATNWLSEFVAKHPELAVMLATIGGVATILGSIMIPAGFLFQMSMLTDSMKVLALQSKLAAGNVDKLTKFKITSLLTNPLFWAAAAAALLAIGVYKAYQEFPELKEVGSSALDSIKTGLMDTVANMFDMFGVTIDTTDALYFLGSAFNLIFVSAATGINAGLSAINLLIDALKIAGQYAALGVVNIKGMFNYLNPFKSTDEKIATETDLKAQASAIEDLIAQTYSDAAQTQVKFIESNQNLNDEFNQSWIGMTEGRDAALLYRQEFDALNGITNTQISDVIDLNTVNFDLVSSSNNVSEALSTEKQRVDSLAKSYRDLNKAKKRDDGRTIVKASDGMNIQSRFLKEYESSITTTS